MLNVVLKSGLGVVQKCQSNEIDVPFIVSQLEFLEALYIQERKRKEK
jgi:hypothetical protein